MEVNSESAISISFLVRTMMVNGRKDFFVAKRRQHIIGGMFLGYKMRDNMPGKGFFYTGKSRLEQ